MIWLALLNAFACGLNLSLTVWHVVEGRRGQASWSSLASVASGTVACALAVRV